MPQFTKKHNGTNYKFVWTSELKTLPYTPRETFIPHYNIIMDEKVKPMGPIVSRTGGKSRLAKRINSLIPEHEIYVELFVGGGSVFFNKGYRSRKEVVNDLDSDIADIYRDFKSVGDKIIGKSFIPTRGEFDKLLRTTKHRGDPVSRLYRNIYVSKFSFSGNRSSYIGKNQESFRGFNNLQNGIPKYNTGNHQRRLQGVTIESADFKKLIKKYDSPKTFFYLDPPYSRAAKNKDYVEVGVTIEEVYNAVKNIKGKFLISYDDVPEAKQIFKQFNIIRVETKYNDGKGGQTIGACELLIANYPISGKKTLKQ
tara:strand:- start:234 stop:1166 length:933 start_codon:yes stop_codon:yes gene_type:complete